MVDVYSLGEVMLRLAPPRFERLRRARSLDIEVAGAQLNVVANLARFGVSSGFISKLPDNELGLLARDMCMSYGVDMTHVHYESDMRMGINFLEFSPTPRTPIAIFDRKNSAASSLSADEFNWEEVLKGAKWAHTDGIFPGLSQNTLEATRIYLQTARSLGLKTSFDVNYRDHLWTPERARHVWEDLLPLINVVVTNRGVSEMVFGITGSDAQIAQQYVEHFGCELVAVTTREMYGLERGAWSSVAIYKGEIIHGKRFEFNIIDRYGTGDVFCAGLIYGYLRENPTFALNFANAACALSHTIEGDVAHMRADEVLPLLNDTLDLRVKR